MLKNFSEIFSTIEVDTVTGEYYTIIPEQVINEDCDSVICDNQFILDLSLYISDIDKIMKSANNFYNEQVTQAGRGRFPGQSKYNTPVPSSDMDGVSGGTIGFTLGTSGIVVNENSEDAMDFRVESTNDTHKFQILFLFLVF